MKPNTASPFVGLRLSDQSGPPERGLDQQLFTAPQTPSQELPRKPASTVKTAKTSTAQSFNRGATVPAVPATTTPRHHGETVDAISQAVKHLGKEAATHRFTDEEKRALADIVYNYRRRGVRTSENELTRIAIHFLLDDYQVNGANSVLGLVLERLYA